MRQTDFCHRQIHGNGRIHPPADFYHGVFYLWIVPNLNFFGASHKMKWNKLNHELLLLGWNYFSNGASQKLFHKLLFSSKGHKNSAICLCSFNNWLQTPHELNWQTAYLKFTNETTSMRLPNYEKGTIFSCRCYAFQTQKTFCAW